jgi:peroxiredoxin
MSVHSKTAAVGMQAPDFELVDQHGAAFLLSEARSAGPVVLVFLRGFS